ncbi:MAG: hypothetical protein M3527_09450 [Actinomycetota bacterium]|nr:hypothetical protein [Acidimicrobiia bacterium]MDQ3294655.1 hypothetical protein [Actinomycetota bacterium]
MVDNDVTHVPSSSSGTCMAASLAMMTGRSEEEMVTLLAAAHAEVVLDDGHADVLLSDAASTVGLREGYVPGNNPDAWAEQLAYGPIAVELKQGHVVVLKAIHLSEDAAVEATVVLLDPWSGEQQLTLSEFLNLGIESIAVPG